MDVGHVGTNFMLNRFFIFNKLSPPNILGQRLCNSQSPKSNAWSHRSKVRVLIDLADVVTFFLTFVPSVGSVCLVSFESSCLRCRRWHAKAPIEISILRHTTCATKVLQSLPWRAFISDPDPTRSEILHHSERPNWTAKMPLTYEAMPASSCKSQAVLLFNILCHKMSWLALLKFVNPLWVKSHVWYCRCDLTWLDKPKIGLYK